MKQSHRVLGLIGIGVLLIAVCYGIQQRILSIRRQKQAALAAQAVDPKLQSIQEQLGKLLNAVHTNPQDPAPHRALADFYQLQHLFDLALEQRIVVANMNPENVEDRLHVGSTLIALHSYPQAEGIYQYTTKHWPKNIAGWQGYSTALYHQRRYREAWESAQQALRLDTADSNSHLLVAISALSYALQYPDLKAHADTLMMARQELEKLTQLSPDNGELFYQLSLASEAQRDQKAMLAYSQRAVVLLPTRGDAAATLARAYNVRGDKANVRKTLEEALARGIKDPILYDMLGQLIQASGEPEADSRAMEQFHQALLLRPKSSTYLEHYAAACVRVNKLKEAQLAFEQVTQLKPYRPFAYQQLAAVYTRLGLTAQASEAAKMATEMYHNENQLKQIQQLSAIHPDSVQLHLILADRYREMKMQGASRDEYLGILQLDPKNERARAGLKALEATAQATAAASAQSDAPASPLPSSQPGK